MLALGLALNLAGLGLLLWLTFVLAVYALPFFIAVSAAAMAFDRGGGITGALIVAVLSAALTLAICQLTHSMARLIVLRGIIGVAFAVPAGIAGYRVTLALSQIAVPWPFWREAFACGGAIFIAGRAWMQITVFEQGLNPGKATKSASTGSDLPDA